MKKFSVNKFEIYDYIKHFFLSNFGFQVHRNRVCLRSPVSLTFSTKNFVRADSYAYLRLTFDITMCLL